ncbi:hypothetical protein BT69DRAFT_75038 [Atractiella rhizophila]|nr:hypothetical protein BT69DRAFT_75038 [Atractiella rhizophila]
MTLAQLLSLQHPSFLASVLFSSSIIVHFSSNLYAVRNERRVRRIVEAEDRGGRTGRALRWTMEKHGMLSLTHHGPPVSPRSPTPSLKPASAVLHLKPTCFTLDIRNQPRSVGACDGRLRRRLSPTHAAILRRHGLFSTIG